MITTAYGPPAAEALHRAVAAAKGGDPLAPVTIVVPSNYVGVAARRQLASGGLGPLAGRGAGVAGVTLLTPYRLAELLGAPALAAGGRRPVSTPVVTAALRHALRAEPGVFEPVAGHPATEEALVGAFRELADVSSRAQAALAACSPRASDVVRLCAAARAHLRPGWYDEADLLDAATSATEVAPVARELGTVVVHLPQQLSQGAGRLLQALGARGPLVVIAGLTGDDRADADVHRSLERLCPCPAAPGPAAPSAAAVEVLTASDADDEVRAVVRRIIAALGEGVPAERIAVLYGTRDPYARILHEQLAGAGIPFNGTAVRPVSERGAGRALLRTLALPAARFARPDTLALLTGAPILDPEGRWVPAAAWDRLSREAGVVRDLDDWDRRLTLLADRLEAEAAAEEAAPEPRPWSIEGRRRDAERARALRAWVLALGSELARGARLASWPATARWAGDLLRRLLGGEAARARWPAAEQRAADRVDATLERLAGLEGVADRPTLEEFARTLEAELDDDLGRTGRLGEGVLVGALGLGLGLDLDVVVVVGAAEGLLPARVSDDALLPDHERAATAGELPLRADTLPRQHRELVAAVAAARHRVILAAPRGDLRRSAEQVPSRWLLRIAGEQVGRRLWPADLAALDEPWVTHVPSFAAGVTRGERPATAQEYRLRALATTAAGALPGHPLVSGDPALAAAVELTTARRSVRFTRFDGNLAGCAVPSPVSSTTSATAMQAYATCPHRYLLEHVLRVSVPEEPEELLRISPLEQGSLVHQALEAFLTEVLAGGAAPRPDEPWPPVRRARLRELADEACDRYEARGLTGRAVFWRRDRRQILRNLDRLLDEDDRRRAVLGATPVAAELSFGRSSSGQPAVPIELPDGRVVGFRGSADRVDVCAGGRLLVVDYKTGSIDGYRGLSEDDPDLGATLLQLPVYSLAARAWHGRPDAPVRAEYWFITPRADFREVGYEVTPAVLERFRAVLDTLVASIEQGAFPARPPHDARPGKGGCPFCDPDGLGVSDVIRAWGRIRTAPELARLVALLEPGRAVDGEDDDG